MFDWKQLIDIAEELLAHKSPKASDEMIFRSSINRLYYGAHGTASMKLETKQLLPTNHSVHGEVIKRYKALSDPRGKIVGNLLATLLQYRKDADYNVNGTTTSGQSYDKALCLQLIGKARTVCGEAKKCKL